MRGARARVRAVLPARLGVRRAAQRSSPPTRRSRRSRPGGEATPSQIALAWLLHRSERILLIPGTSSVEHLEENIAAGEIELDEDDMRRLEDGTQLGDPMAAVRALDQEVASVASATRVAASAGA